MKYEIINPSDECYIESENETVACFCTLLLGNGMYALNNDNDETILPVLVGYDADEWEENHIGDVEKFISEHIDEIIQCLRSVEYARERTSMNNIRGLAFAYADSIEKHKNDNNNKEEQKE